MESMIHFSIKENVIFYIKNNLYTLKEIKTSILKVTTNQTFRLSKLKNNMLPGLSVRRPDLNDAISCSPVGV